MWKHIKQRRDVSAGITHKRGECVCHTRALARTCYASSKMQGEATTYNTVKANVVTVEQLVEASPKTLEIVRESLGRDGLGIIAVAGVEGLTEARQNLLPLADAIAQLPAEELSAIEDPESFFGVGWSHGKEKLEGGVPDFLKGSFYANPIHDKLEVSEKEYREHPSYTRPNLWPKSIPSLRPSFRNLGDIIVEKGQLLSGVCDRLVADALDIPDTGNSSIQKAIENSFCAKARLLHYYPPSAFGANGTKGNDSAKMGDWCGWHLDHGSLTGLTAAMFTDCNGNQVDNPDPKTCGLYVKSRKGITVRVTYGADCLAYQMGEASQIMSGGVLEATPHCVVGASGDAAKGVARNTFAVFMQPKWDKVMIPISDSDNDSAATKGWEPNMTFGEFTHRRLNEYYS